MEKGIGKPSVGADDSVCPLAASTATRQLIGTRFLPPP